MAGSAALDLGLMLIDEGPLLVGMALVANLVIPVGLTQLVGEEATMRIVAIAAL